MCAYINTAHIGLSRSFGVHSSPHNGAYQKMSMSTLRHFLWLGALLLATIQVSALPTAQDLICNGHPEYCDRRYSELSFVGAHNSPFVGPLLQHNQDISVTEQLDFGIRFLQGQTHKNDDGVFSMCHTSCILEDAGSVSSYLQTVKTWLDSHPNEVVTLLITNGDGLDIKEFDDAFNAVNGIKDYTFAPKSKLALGDWPTLRELITTGKRLIVFVGKCCTLWIGEQTSLLLNFSSSYILTLPEQIPRQTPIDFHIYSTSFHTTLRLHSARPMKTSLSVSLIVQPAASLTGRCTLLTIP